MKNENKRQFFMMGWLGEVVNGDLIPFAFILCLFGFIVSGSAKAQSLQNSLTPIQTTKQMSDERWFSEFNFGGNFSDAREQDLQSMGLELHLTQDQATELKKFHELCQIMEDAGKVVMGDETKVALVYGPHEYRKGHEKEQEEESKKALPDPATIEKDKLDSERAEKACLAEVGNVRKSLGEKEEEIIFLMREKAFVESQQMSFAQQKRKDPSLDPENFAETVFQKYINTKRYKAFCARRTQEFKDPASAKEYLTRRATLLKTKLLLGLNLVYAGEKDKAKIEQKRQKNKEYQLKIQNLLNE